MNQDKQKKTLYNIIMIVGVLLILFSGIMFAGSKKGWFDKNTTTQANGDGGNTNAVIVKNKVGNANIERGGIAYALKDNTKLKDGDIIETLNRSSLTIYAGKNIIDLNQNSEVIVKIQKEGEPFLELVHGEAFAQVSEQMKWKFMEQTISVTDAVFGVSVPTGSTRVTVFEKSLQMGEEKIEAGKAVDVLETGIKVADFSINSLNDFYIQHIRETNKERKLCCTNEDLKKVEDKRKAEVEKAKKEQKQKEELAKRIKQEQKNQSAMKENSGSSQTQSQSSSASNGNQPSSGEGSTQGPTQSKGPQCTIEIRCDTILNNMSELDAGKSGYVPSNGTILATSTLEFKDGETVFDVLKRACDLAGIQLEYSWTPMYNSYYVEGINNLYEFDCGNESGWMYKVNGWFPNYGCSAYTLKDGDTIVWCYTCKGLGADVGGGM